MKYIDLSRYLLNKKDIKNNSVNEEAINNSIKNILNTPKGSFPGHPEFGCKLNNFLFELINPLIIILIEEEVRYALTRWEQRITIQELKATEDMDYNRLHVYLKYTVLADVQGRSYDFTFKKDLNK